MVSKIKSGAAMAWATVLPSHCYAKTSYRILGQIPAGIGDLCHVHVHIYIYVYIYYIYIYVIYIPWFQGVYGEFV